MPRALNSESGHEPIIIVLVGMPASGKTVLADKLCYLRPGTLRVSSDDLIAMHRQKYSYDSQKAVRAAEDAFVRAAIEQGYDVVIDRTNLTRNHRNRWMDMAVSLPCVGAMLIQVRNAGARYLNLVRPERERVPENVLQRMDDSHEPIAHDEHPAVLQAIELDMTPSQFTDWGQLVEGIWCDIAGIRP